MNINDLVNLVEEGWRVRNVPRLNGLRGMCYPDKNLILVCRNECKDLNDYKITIAHELYHSLDENLSEGEVEFKAKYLNDFFPEIIDFAIDLFNIK